MKITAAQNKALDSLKAIGSPATSQEIGTQVKTMQALAKHGLVTQVQDEAAKDGRECEVIKWSLN